MQKFFLMGMVTAALLFVGRSVVVYADANDTRITGEVIDTFCYVTMGAHGGSHRQCGLNCAKKGIPVGIIPNGSNKLYILLPNKDATALPDAVINKMGQTATITGHVYSKGGNWFLTVESVG